MALSIGFSQGTTPSSNYSSEGLTSGDLATITGTEMPACGAIAQRVGVEYGVTQQIEGEPWIAYDSVIEAYLDAGYEVLIVLDGVLNYGGATLTPSECASWATSVADHYGPMGVSQWELINEPNYGGNWYGGSASPSEYVAIVQAMYAALKAQNADCTVILGGMANVTGTGSYQQTDWLTDIYSNGGQGYFDQVGVHTGVYDPGANSNPSPLVSGGPITTLMPEMRTTMVANGDSAKPMVVTEAEIPSANVGTGAEAATPTLQASYLTAALGQLDSYSYVTGPYYCYTLSDQWSGPGTLNDDDYDCGVFDSSGTAKPAVEVLAEFTGNTGTGALSFSGSGTASVHVVASGSGHLALAASGTAVVHVVASGTGHLAFASSGSAAVEMHASGTGHLGLSGTATATVKVSTSGSGHLSLSGSGSASITTHGSGGMASGLQGVGLQGAQLQGGPPGSSVSGTGNLSFSGSGTATLWEVVSGTGTLAFSGSGTAATTVTASGTGHLSLSGSGTAAVHVAASGTGHLSLSGTGTASGETSGSGHLSLGGVGTAVVRVYASGSGTLSLAGSGTAVRAVHATGSGALSFAGSGSAVVQVHASGTGHLSLSGTAVAVFAVHASGTGTLTFGGTGIIGDHVLASGSGALAFSGSGTASVVLVSRPTGTGVVTFLGTGTATNPPTLLVAQSRTLGLLSTSRTLVLEAT